MTTKEHMYSLGPPRSGRIVRDAKDVIREIEIETEKEKITLEHQGTSSSVESTNPLQESNPAFSHQIYNFHKLNSTADYQELCELDVPEGHWKRIKLLTAAGRDSKYLRGWTYWVDNARENKLATAFGLTNAPSHLILCPLRALYWFLRAGYQSQNSESQYSVINFIREAFPPTRTVYFPELINFEDGEISIRTRGLPAMHPLYSGYLLIRRSQEDQLQDFCENFLGDTKPHVEAVLSWYTKAASDKSARIILPDGVVPATCATLYHTSNQAVLDLNAGFTAPLPAFCISADPVDFTPNEVRP